MVEEQDRSDHSRKRYLLSAIMGIEWGHHARSKIRSSDNIVEMIENMHEAIDYFESLKKKNRTPGSDYNPNTSTTLFGDNFNYDDDNDYNDQMPTNFNTTDDTFYQKIYTQNPQLARQSRFGHRPSFRSR